MFQGRGSKTHQQTKQCYHRQAAMTESNLYARKLYPVNEAALLLSGEKQQRLCTYIQTLLNAPEKAYQDYCLPLIHHVAELIQQIPGTAESRFHYAGGRLDFILERTGATLRLFQEYLGESNAANYVLEQPDLWRYTLFTVALLQHIGNLVSHYEIILFDENKESIGVFSPFSGNMAQHGHFYEAIFNKNGDNEERNTATLLLARQLMPTVGLNWINQSREAFRFWSMTLIGDSIEQGGRYFTGPMQILTEALARILNRSLPAEHLLNPKNQLFEKQSDSDEALEEKAEQSLASLIKENTENTRAAEAFLEDLKEHLDLGEENRNQLSADEERISVNTRRSSVHLVEENEQRTWFLGLDLIQQYAKKYQVTWQQMIKQLSQLQALGKLYNQAQLAIGPEATRTISGVTLSARNAALRTDVPALGISPTLKLHGDAVSQRIFQMNNGTWPQVMPKSTVSPQQQNSQQAQEQAKINLSQNTFSKW
ncbi:MAG: putative helicase/relaxase [Gammaproteobacteria bacterium]|jgi:hypothetical protein|nr:putative helicase/relaxase [Gammaproteobacteria bacterium]